MKKQREVAEARYQMELGAGYDLWRFCGQLFDSGVDMYFARPIAYDLTEETVTTSSGSTYKIVSYGMNKTEFWKEVIADVERGSIYYK